MQWFKGDIVILLGDDDPPAWLNVRHPRLRIVRHESYFKEQSALPTFSSDAIQMNMHRIDGLGVAMINWCDDYFLGRCAWGLGVHAVVLVQPLPSRILLMPRGNFLFSARIPVVHVIMLALNWLQQFAPLSVAMLLQACAPRRLDAGWQDGGVSGAGYYKGHPER